MTIGAAQQFFLGASKATGGGAAGYQIERSLRFNSSDSAFCSRTPAVAGNRRTWTWAGWVKKCSVDTSAGRNLFSADITSTSDATFFELRFGTGAYPNSLAVGGYNTNWRITTQVFRDVSAWYHIVLAVDTTQATGANRIKIYVNGSQVTSFVVSSDPTQNTDLGINNTTLHNIAKGYYDYFNGYLAECYLIDGQALTPSSFTEVSATTGQLIPKAYSGTFGTNGFWLKFSDNSAATAATLGKDYSGNSNNWTPNNLSVTAGAGNDSLVDTPTSIPATDTGVGGEIRGNYCTLNPLNNGGITLSNGNLDWAGNGGGTKVSYGTVAVSSGKWYFEASINGATGGVNWECGIARVGTANNSRPGATANGWQVSSSSTTTLFKNNSGSSTSIYSSGLSNGDILSVAFDVDNGRIWFARNGTWLEGSPSAGTGASFTNVSGTVAPFGGSDGSGPSSAMNFGQRAFAYTAPSGFKALCDTNLGAPLVAKGNTVMDVKLYTGNGSTQTISGLGFSPDFVWIKTRSASGYAHILQDTVRGAGKSLASQNTNVEVGNAGDFIGSFNSDGFSVNTTYLSGTAPETNGNGDTFVGWAWDAGTSTVSNTAGSITSQVRANVSAGFSVVTYTGNGTQGATIGHGLNVIPQLVIIKNRTSTDQWDVYHISTGYGGVLRLNSTAAFVSAGDVYPSSHTSSVIKVGNSASQNGNGNNMVAYCFSPVVGYSSVSSYVGNGSSDGPFVYTGFRPRWIMFKKSSATSFLQSWNIFDALRLGYNASNNTLYPNSASQEVANNALDILSNGFKIRVGDSYDNESGATYIYAAFAESPFQFSRAR